MLLIFNGFICYMGCCHRHRTQVFWSSYADSASDSQGDFQTFSLTLELHLWPLLFRDVQRLQLRRCWVPWLSNRQTALGKQPLPVETNLISPFFKWFVFETSPPVAKLTPNCCLAGGDLELLSDPPASGSRGLGYRRVPSHMPRMPDMPSGVCSTGSVLPGNPLWSAGKTKCYVIGLTWPAVSGIHWRAERVSRCLDKERLT